MIFFILKLSQKVNTFDLDLGGKLKERVNSLQLLLPFLLS